MNSITMTKRILQQLKSDKRTLIMLFILPIILMTLIYLLFNTTIENSIALVVSDEVSPSIVELLEKDNINIHTLTTDLTKEQFSIEYSDYDGYLYTDDNKYYLILTNTNTTNSLKLKSLINKAFTNINITSSLNELSTKLNIDTSTLNSSIQETDYFSTTYIYGNENTSFTDTFIYILMSFFVFFFVFLISGIGLLKERTSGTLERLLSTPIKRYEIIFGYLIGFGVIAIIQTIIIVTYSIYALDIISIGSISLTIFINILVAFVALSLGIFLSSFAKTEFQMIQFIPLIVIPQIFFSGIIPVDSLPTVFQQLCYIMPVYHSGTAITEVLYMGATLSDISTHLVVLFAMASILIISNIVVLKKYRTL